ncbi:MAG: winged helix-turn-helix domain-containing protein [Anaerolineae bacterium]|nr:winged helix-turn-helix domain-containing protein [Anaerolineae bacterium]
MNEDYQTDLSGWDSNAATKPIMICLLGNFRLMQAGQLMPIRAGGKSEALLTYLGLQHGRRVSREQLVQTLWPDTDFSLGINSLHNLIHNINKNLGPALQGAAPVLHQEGYYQLNITAGMGVDVADFDELVATGDRHDQVGNPAAALISYRHAIDLYRDDLYMSALSADAQIIVERERLRVSYLRVLGQVADHYYQANDYTTALQYVWQLLGQDPCREDAHRLVMRCLVRRGERAAALHHYQVCLDLLRDHLDVTPEPATVVLFEQIRVQPDQI